MRLWLLIALFALVACSRPAPPLVLLISIDALRADRLGLNGYSKPTSPFLDSLGARGTSFRNAYVGTHGTTPSHATILSGAFQQTHRVGMRSKGGVVESGLPGELPLLPEILRSRGFFTIAVTDGGNVGRSFGFARGFDAFDDRGGGLENVAQRALRHILDARVASPNRPIFAFLHTYEVHSPYDPPEKYRRAFAVPADVPAATSEFLLEHANSATTSLSPGTLAAISSLYDAGIRFTDDLLRAFFAELERVGALDRAIVVVTSDHGEEFGEHGGLLHRDLLYEELVRVPLILSGTDVPRGRVIEDLASSVDIVPTLLDALDLPIPAGLPGISLLDTEALAKRKAVVAQYGKSIMVRTRRWKLIRHRRMKTTELYDLEADPSERTDVSAKAPAARKELEQMLADWQANLGAGFTKGRAVELRDEEVRALRSLGYVAGDEEAR